MNKKIKITIIISLFISIVSVTHASDTTVINNVSVNANSGGITASPGESITTGISTSEVYIETQINDEDPIVIHEIVTSDENTEIVITQVIENDGIRTEITTSTIKNATTNMPITSEIQNTKINTTSSIEILNDTDTVDKYKTISEAPDNPSIFVEIIRWLTEFFSKIFS